VRYCGSHRSGGGLHPRAHKIGPVLALIALVFVGVAIIVVAAVALLRSATEPRRVRYPDPERVDRDVHEKLYGERSGTVSAPLPAASGPEALAQAVRPYMGAFEEHGYEVERLTVLGSGEVLALVCEGGGKSRGVPVRHSFAVLYTVIDGEIGRINIFRSEDQALEAAGLSE
jgi:hypothetical protein